ncbi:IS3 family transposase, partial [Glaciimonas sp. GS1]
MAKKGQVRARYTAEFKQESVRLVQAGQSIAAVSRNIAVSEQTLYNWVKAARDGQLSEAKGNVVTPEQMELSRLRAENARLKMERDILKKAASVLCERIDVKYAFIKNNAQWSVKVVCQLLDVSTSGYHDYCRRQVRPMSTTARHREEGIVAHMKAIHHEVKQEYGWPRMHRELAHRGIRVGKERVQKLMQRHGIRARHKRKWIATTNSHHSLPVAPNLLERNFTPAAPNRVWSSDITYIHTEQGWLYLTVMLDLYSRQIVGWSMQNHMRAELVDDALKMAWFRRQPKAGFIVHSDRGSQYCSKLFQDSLTAYGMRSSMSRKGNCWDNSPPESLWGALKVARIHGKKFATQREAKDEIVDWINFYNARRQHSTLGYVSSMN